MNALAPGDDAPTPGDERHRAGRAALKVLDGAPDSALPRVSARPIPDPDFTRLADALLEHERQIEQRENQWLSRNRQ